MPDKYGALSEEEFSAAKDWLSERSKLPCSACGKRSWALARHVISLRADVNDFFGETNYYPALLMICANCGHFRLHGARRVGIKRYEEKAEEKAEDAE